MTQQRVTNSGKKNKIEKKDKPVPQAGGTRKAVDAAIKKIGDQLQNNPVKATVGDFIRLLQLQKELQADDAKEVRVTWVDPAETESVFEE